MEISDSSLGVVVACILRFKVVIGTSELWKTKQQLLSNAEGQSLEC